MSADKGAWGGEILIKIVATETTWETVTMEKEKGAAGLGNKTVEQISNN